MKQEKILVIVKRPGEAAYVEPCFENTLEAFQQVVGGYIEVATIASDLVLVFNEEGRLMDLPYNCTVCGLPLVGTAIAVSTDRDEFASIPSRFVPTVMKLFKEEKR